MKGNLKKHLELWDVIGASSFTLTVIKYGYKLTFHTRDHKWSRVLSWKN